jgi:exopolyphosphatase/guanosine-5'-triphosphate,3'-diphosphate pyrophosphatase
LRIAALDIGTNSIHLIVVRGRPDLTFEVIDREKDMVKLGSGAFRLGRLSDAAFAAGLKSLTCLRKIIDRHRVDRIVAVATSAVREAENGPAFLEAVRVQTGVLPRTISGEEEARLIHVAVRSSIDLKGRRALILDIGGGSVEIIVGDSHRVLRSRSLQLGVLRVLDWIAGEDPLSRDTHRKLADSLRERVQIAIREARKAGFDGVIGTSGTILNLGLAVHLRRGHERWISPHGRVVPLDELRALSDELMRMDQSGRGRVAGIDGERADTIHLGGLLLVTLLEQAGADRIMLCDWSVREGLVEEVLEQEARRRGADVAIADIRRRSVVDLLRRCGQDTPHARLIARLALSIFDQTRAAHGCGARERELLEFAALLHDVGRSISFERHEQHSHYLIRHGDLRGFSQEEVELIALAARYHRKAKPRNRQKDLAPLPPGRQRMIAVLAGILRVAEGLDRRHLDVVEAVDCKLTPKRLRVRVRARTDADVEIWSARRKASVLERALNRAIEIQRKESRVEAHGTA